MAIHLRQVALVATKLAPVINNLKAVLGILPCYVDPGIKQFGLENTLLAVGTDFVEVVAPIQKNTAAGRYLKRLGGDGGYMVICQAPNKAEQQACRQRAADNQVRVAWEYEEDKYRIMQLHPSDMRATFLEVDWTEPTDTKGYWPPAGGNGWQDTSKPQVLLAGVELQSPDPKALAEHWSNVVGVKPKSNQGAPIIKLDNAELRFVADNDGRGPGLSGVHLRTDDPAAILRRGEQHNCLTAKDTVTICGVRFIVSG